MLRSPGHANGRGMPAPTPAPAVNAAAAAVAWAEATVDVHPATRPAAGVAAAPRARSVESYKRDRAPEACVHIPRQDR